MKVTVATLLGSSRRELGSVAERAAQVQQQEALYLWLRDSAGVLFSLPGLPEREGALSEEESLTALRLLLDESAFMELERALRQARLQQPARLSRLLDRLESALDSYLRSPATTHEDSARLVWAWAEVVKFVAGKDVMYARYERRIKAELALVSESERELRRDVRRVVRRAARRIRQLVRVARAILRRAREERVSYTDFTTARWRATAAPPSVPAPPTAAHSVPDAPAPAPAPEAREHRHHQRSRMKELRRKLQARLVERRLRESRKRAAELHRQRKAAVKAALRRRKARALVHPQLQQSAPLLHAAVIEAIRWGALRSRRLALRVLHALRGKEHNLAAIAAAVDVFGLHEPVLRLVQSYESAVSFESVVDSAADGGRDAERRLVEALRERGLTVRVDRSADRRGGVDLFVSVGGSEVAVQITTMSWWSATEESLDFAQRRLENGRWVYGAPVSKLQKDLEKYDGSAPYLFIGINCRMPFAPEQYADDVVKLVQAAESGGVHVAFIAAPGCVVYQEVR